VAVLYTHKGWLFGTCWQLLTPAADCTWHGSIVWKSVASAWLSCADAGSLVLFQASCLSWMADEVAPLVMVPQHQAPFLMIQHGW